MSEIFKLEYMFTNVVDIWNIKIWILKDILIDTDVYNLNKTKYFKINKIIIEFVNIKWIFIFNNSINMKIYPEI